MPDWWMLNPEDLHDKGMEDVIDPTVNDDSSKGFKVSSHWVNITNDNAFICVDATLGAAVWRQVDPVTGLLNNLNATTDPDADEDSGDGYSIGSRWINVTLNKEFVCLDNTLTSAVWKETTIVVSVLLDKLNATVAPDADNDNTEGYSVGSKWVDVTADKAYICVDTTTATAVWIETTQSGGTTFGGALVTASVDQSIANSTNVLVNWNIEARDTDSIHDNVTNNERLTVPTGWTKVRLVVKIKWGTSAVGDNRYVALLKNNDTDYSGFIDDNQTGVGNPTNITNFISSVISVVATDYFSVRVFQNSGGALNVHSAGIPANESFFEMIRVE